MAAERASDPYRIYRFIVEITGLQVAGFSEVSGIQADIQLEEINEGGINDYVHRLAKRTSYGNLTLKRGFTDDTQLWDWHQDVIHGTVKRQTISILLLGQQGEEKWRWSFQDAYPVKWNGGDLNAANASVAVESIEFAHNGYTRS